jgi:predicted dehydrogenase
MKIVIVGFGSIARRHIRNLKEISPESEIGLWRQLSKDMDIGDYSSLVDSVFLRGRDLLAWGPEIALVTNPASMHVETSLLLANAGVHLFVEKPLSHDLEGVDELIGLCRTRKLVLMVGYSFRYYAPLQTIYQALQEERIGRLLYLRAEVGQYLPDWRPGEDYRNGVSAHRELGGGAVLELSHELDYALWLLGNIKALSARVERLSDLDIEVEDIAEIVLHFESGAIGSIHMDMVQRTVSRICRIVGTQGTITWDWNGHRVEQYTSDKNEWTNLYDDNKLDRNGMYLTELRHFLECVDSGKDPLTNGGASRRIIETVLAIKQSSKTGEVIEL